MESPFAAGSMYSTGTDLLNWLRFFQKQLGKNNALRNLVQSSLAGTNTNLYSAGWCVLPNELVHTGHINGFANLVSIDTQHHRTVVILSNSSYQHLYIMQETLISLLDKNKDALQWMSQRLPVKQLNEYTGIYKNNKIEILIKNENGKLMSYINENPIELLHLSKDIFFIHGLDGDIIFLRNDHNEVNAVKSFQDYSFSVLKKMK